MRSFIEKKPNVFFIFFYYTILYIIKMSKNGGSIHSESYSKKHKDYKDFALDHRNVTMTRDTKEDHCLAYLTRD